MRRIKFLLAALLLTAASVSAQAQIAETKFRLASVFPSPEVSLASQAAKMWMDEVTKRSGGKVTFQTHWGGDLGKPPEYLNLVQSGAVDLVVTTALYTPGKLPLENFEYVFPFGPVNAEVVTKAKRTIRKEFPQFSADLAKYNIVGIMNPSGAAYQLLSKTPLSSIEDFKGKKVSLIGRYFGRWISAAGAAPVVAPAHERYSMMQTGVVDVDLLPVDLFTSFRVYEQAKNYVEIDSLLANYFDLWFNKPKFDKLSPELQKLMLEAGEAVELQVAKDLIPAWTKRSLEQFEKAGVKPSKFPAEQRSKWAQMVEDIPAEWAKEVEGQGYPGTQVVKRFQELTTGFGYTWPRKWGEKK